MPTTDEALSTALKGLLFDEGARATLVKQQHAVLPQFNHLHDGRASERVAALVVQLAGQDLARDRAPVPPTTLREPDWTPAT